MEGSYSGVSFGGVRKQHIAVVSRRGNFKVLAGFSVALLFTVPV